MGVILSEEAQEVVVKTKRRIIGVHCDICDRAIPLMRYGDEKCKYFRVMEGHHDWGNDSCDSIKYYDICPGCLGEFVSEYFTGGSETAYLNINTEYAYPGYRYE